MLINKTIQELKEFIYLDTSIMELIIYYFIGYIIFRNIQIITKIKFGNNIGSGNDGAGPIKHPYINISILSSLITIFIIGLINHFVIIIFDLNSFLLEIITSASIYLFILWRVKEDILGFVVSHIYKKIKTKYVEKEGIKNTKNNRKEQLKQLETIIHKNANIEQRIKEFKKDIEIDYDNIKRSSKNDSITHLKENFSFFLVFMVCLITISYVAIINQIVSLILFFSCLNLIYNELEKINHINRDIITNYTYHNVKPNKQKKENN